MARGKSISKAYRDYAKKMKNLTPDEKEKLEAVERLALELMKQYNVDDLQFGFGYSNYYRGNCNSNKIKIQYEYALYSPIEEIKNTILHEIAHAIVGVGCGHRIEWQNKAKEMGVKFRKNYRK